MKIDNVLTLPDGRELAYAEFGKPDGHPVLYCHGAPCSRLEPLLLEDDVYSQLGLRVICPDRPGMGQSDFQSDRGFSDWPKDVIFLMEALTKLRLKPPSRLPDLSRSTCLKRQLDVCWP
jgi:pimeloyl-ACP methyl ester carboxylesterase